jgi:hypothetical protein
VDGGDLVWVHRVRPDGIERIRANLARL